MKFKLLCGILFVGICINGYALNGKDFTLLSETIETSPGLTGGFISKNSPSPQPYVSTSSRAHDASGRAHQNIRLDGDHRLTISNYTAERQIYTYVYELICDGKYIRKTDKIVVSPHGYVTDWANSYLWLSQSSPGSWTINVNTTVTGESSSNDTAYGRLRVEK